MAKKLLLIEDSKEIYQMISQTFTNTLVEIEWADTIKKGQDFLDKNSYDLVLLDVELPDGNGLEFCGQIQLNKPDLPIFILTSHDSLSEKVLGFSAGADDYITKPFNMLELKARVEARLKKLEILSKNNDFLKWKNIEINKASQDVYILINGDSEKIDLTTLEFKILTYFAQVPGNVINRDKMLDDIWGEDIHVYSRSVDTHVSKLRKKLGPVSGIIESVHGAGYKFNPDADLEL